jgi:hypothetical protein
MSGELGSGEFWARFAIATLATWRLTHLIVFEDGPADLLVRLRRRAGHGFWGKLMDCFYCVSFWVAAPLAPTVSQQLTDAVLIWVALSGSACLLERATAPPIQFGGPAMPNESEEQ